MAYTDTPLCQFNGGCIGCCGHDYPCAKTVEIALDKNTLEFKDFKKRDKTPKEFRDRAARYELRSGLCRNAIKSKGKLLCSIHPLFAQTDKDLRKRHCDIRYLCKTAKTFSKWDENTKKKFIRFTKKKKENMTQVEYSLAMDADRLLKEFFEQ